MRPVSFFSGGILLLTLAMTARDAIASVCTLGETAGFPKTTVPVDQFPALSVYQLLDASQCTACGGRPGVLNSVSWQFAYHTTVPCPVTLEVAVVRSDRAACPRRDTSNVLCPAFTYTYAATGAPPHIATIPLPAGCCISGQAFVRVSIKDNGCGSGILFFVEHSECTAPCLAYATFTGGPLDDACSYFIGIPSITMAVDCCNVTPTHRTSWGDLKVHYR